MGKLDATMVANGPEDVLPGWDAVDWQAAEENVRGLRQRIFTASQAGDLARVRNLQKLIFLRSPVERAQQQRLDHRAEERDRGGSERNQQEQPQRGQAERHPAPNEPGGDESADGIEAAMRHIDDAHHAEDEAQARSNEKQNRCIEQCVEYLDDQYGHAASPNGLARRHSLLAR